MAKGMFGGDTSKSHFVVSRRYKAYREEAHRARMARNAEEGDKLKAAGIKLSTYFEYRNGDEAAKARQKAASAYARCLGTWLARGSILPR
jgi:hypothetical protein